MKSRGTHTRSEGTLKRLSQSLKLAYAEGRKARRRDGPLGQRIISRYGHKRYVLLKIGPGTAGWKLEHRHVMSRILGRSLETWEQVHHRNGDTLDNRPENLELVGRREHPNKHSLRLRGQWSRQFAVCTTCGTTKRPHLAKGKCTACYQRR